MGLLKRKQPCPAEAAIRLRPRPSFKSEAIDSPSPKRKGLSYWCLNSLIKSISHIPFPVLYAISDAVYYPLYYLARYRRKIVRKNLTESFPEKSKKEIIDLEKKFYRFFTDMALESCKILSIAPDEIQRRITFKNLDKVNAMLDSGESVAAYIGHYGNWEWLSSLGLTLTPNALSAQIYHKLRNQAMDQIIRDMRERMGNKCVSMDKTVRFMAELSAQRIPCIIGFISDQSPRFEQSRHFLPFLNHDTPVLTGTEKAAKHYGYQAVFIHMRRLKRGYYQCEFVPLHSDPKSLPDFELTRLYYQKLEQMIREEPACYLWTHNRFKHARGTLQ